MKLGTAKITPRTMDGAFVVEWMNPGSFLRNEPRAFWTVSEARQFCAERFLRVVS